MERADAFEGWTFPEQAGTFARRLCSPGDNSQPRWGSDRCPTFSLFFGSCFHVLGYVASVDLQETLALGVVVITAIMFVVSVIRHRRAAAWQKASGCGCTAPSPSARILISGRKGEVVKVTVRH